MFPSWINKVLPGEKGVKIPQRREHNREVAGEWNSLTLSQTVKTVCHSCNTGWMATLEGECAPLLGPMISGAPLFEDLSPDLTTGAITLDSEHQIMVTTWAVKTSMMIAQAFSHPGLLQEEYRRFYETRRPGSNWCCWLAAYAGGERAAGDSYNVEQK